MKSDFYTAIAQIAAERGIPKEAVLSARSSMRSRPSTRRWPTSRRREVEVDIDPTTGGARIFVHRARRRRGRGPGHADLRWPRRGTDAPEHQDRRGPDPIERTPENFGRIAAQTAKQVVLQRIRDYEREIVYDEFADSEGEVLNGIVQRADARRRSSSSWARPRR